LVEENIEKTLTVFIGCFSGATASRAQTSSDGPTRGLGGEHVVRIHAVRQCGRASAAAQPFLPSQK
jgi:hypothetical protein